MGFWNSIFGGVPQLTEEAAVRRDTLMLQDEVAYLEVRLQETEESLLRISDAFDNVGFGPMASEDAKTLQLSTVKKMSEICRSITAINPFVKRGVKARFSYVWGKGVQFDKVDNAQEEMRINRSKLFSNQAYEELEIAAATDGNVFRALPLENDQEMSALRIPLDQITDAVSNPDDFEEIWLYKRQWTVTTTNALTGQQSTKDEIRYYVSLPYYKKLQRQGKNFPRRWREYGVEQNYVMQHITVNRQIGWRWGIPDVAAVVFWANAYKEYLENNADLVKAYSRLAWQIKAQTQTGAQAAAAQVMTPPTRDPFTGQPREVGGTGITGPGVEITPTAVSGSQVDFSKGQPLASAIASGLEVSLVVITSDAGTANRSAAESLDLPTLKAMESRQLLWTEAFIDMFEFWGVTDAIVTWPQIYNDSTKDRIAAVGTADELGRLYPEEARKEILDVLGIAPFKPWDELPNPADDPKNQYKEQMAEDAFKRQQETASQLDNSGSVVPSQGKSGGISAKGGSMSTANQSRDNRKQDSNNS